MQEQSDHPFLRVHKKNQASDQQSTQSQSRGENSQCTSTPQEPSSRKKRRQDSALLAGVQEQIQRSLLGDNNYPSRTPVQFDQDLIHESIKASDLGMYEPVLNEFGQDTSSQNPSLLIQQNKFSDIFSILSKANNNKLYQTMRAYNIKKAKRKSGSQLQGSSDNTHTSNSQRSISSKKISNESESPKQQMSSSKQQSKRTPLQITSVGQNHLKFPPDFFGDQSVQEGSQNRKRSNDQKQNQDPIQVQGSSRVLQKLQIHKVQSEPFFSKYHSAQANINLNRGLPPVLKNMRKYQDTIEENTVQIGQRFAGSNLKVMKLTQNREISQRQAIRAQQNEVQLKIENRQQSAPNPVEAIQIRQALPKVTSVQEIFPSLGKDRRSEWKKPIPQPIPPLKQNNNLIQAIEKNKFLSKIQDQKTLQGNLQKQREFPAGDGGKFSSQDRLIKLKGGLVVKNMSKPELGSCMSDDQFQELIKHNSQVAKLLQPSPTKQILKPISISKKSSSKSSGTEKHKEFVGQYENPEQEKQGIKAIDKKTLEQTLSITKSNLLRNYSLMKDPYSKQQSSMGKYSNKPLGTINESVASHNEEAEMTFGLIGTQHFNQSTSSMQTSGYQFGQTLRQSQFPPTAAEVKLCM